VGPAALDVLVQEGERCPHVPPTPDPSCDPVPLESVAVTVLNQSGQTVASGRSDSHGRVRFGVPAARYVVRGERLKKYSIQPEQPATATDGSTTRVVLTYGNGIQ
jgi:hypothetical protein